MHKWKTLIILLFIIPIFGAANAQEMVNQRHIATRYHNKFVNRKTSSGERFTQKKYTAAHKNMRLGTYVLVVDTVTKKWVVVKVNDRCVGSNVIDLAGIAAERIGLTKRKGVARVLVSSLGEGGEALWQRQDSMPPEYTDSIFSIIQSLSKTATPPPVAENVNDTPAATQTNPKNNTVTKNTAKGTDKAAPQKQTPTKIIISNIESTDAAEDILDEMKPSISSNAKILNNTDNLKIEIILNDDIDNFTTHFIAKHPKYQITIENDDKK